MNDVSRILNRVVLLLVGCLIAAAGAALALWAQWPNALPPWLTEAGARAVERAHQLTIWGARALGLDERLSVAASVLIASLVVLLAVVWFVATRRTQRPSVALTAGGPAGRTEIDPGLATLALAGPLRDRRDVTSARVSLHRVRRVTTIRLAVTVRRGARLDEVISAAEAAVADWDVLAGVRMPVLLHLEGPGLTGRLRAEMRAT
ncbi:hypothetical protein [Leucobacter aridicollis]|uniref:Uncharacterized protein n=1 Tax=Leucobacter aridicollis TaxID=283878 RepID=A0A852RC31_9MICO|nr:hypothetical protein [Leucobacter aridicollis]MBL3683002.1 hypothetical protein [Leucobacter aridicollis]NYD26440.1 hypothetical protein [Leucobacter aridicollis]